MCGQVIASARSHQPALPVVVGSDALAAVKLDVGGMTNCTSMVIVLGAHEYEDFAEAVTGNGDVDVGELALHLGGVIIIQRDVRCEHKDKASGSYRLKDVISNGKLRLECTEQAPPRRLGGLGDILSGVLGILTAWASQRGKGSNLLVHACAASCAVVRKAASNAFAAKKRGLTATDVVEALPATFEELCPV